VLEQADADVVEHAIDAIDALRAIAPCSDADGLLSGVDPPADAAVARDVASIRAALSEARALEGAGKPGDALALARRQYERARTLDYPPILAEAANGLGTLQMVMSEPESATEHFDEALYAAIASGHEVAEARALLGLTACVGLHGTQPRSALRHGEHARAAIARLGDPPAELAKSWMYTAITQGRLREFDQAEAAYRKAVEIAGDDPAARRIRVAALGNLGTVQGMRGDYATSIESLSEARRLAEERLGPAHPAVIKLAINLGSSQSGAGRYREALETFERVRPVAVGTIGARHPDVARIDHNISAAYNFLGEYGKALGYAQRAYEIKREALGPEHHSVAASANNLGDALVNLDRPEDAMKYFEEAMRIWKDDPDRLYGLLGLTQSHLALGDAQAAVAAANEGIALADEVDASPAERGRLLFLAAQATWESGGDRTKARAYAEDALQRLATDEGGAASEAPQVQRWLAAHPVPREDADQRSASK
jgi:tetratricopeptide (TPR) repeat protein